MILKKTVTKLKKINCDQTKKKTLTTEQLSGQLFATLAMFFTETQKVTPSIGHLLVF